ncbi:hypothetical protein C8J57DRAFT_1727742 [Mycena rebaudengoi]|nr:hypothetical protein C8J57DRAFT_1727742 [Mycena rebaudengoi]
MGKRSKLKEAAYRASQANAAQRANQAEDDSDDENLPPAPPADVSGGKPKTLRAQLTERDAQILQLEATIVALRTDIFQLREHNLRLTRDHSLLLQSNSQLSSANKSLNSLKRKTDTMFLEEVRDRNKRVKRLERQREVKKNEANDILETMEESLNDSLMLVAELDSDLSLAASDISARDDTILELKATIRDKQMALNTMLRSLYAAQKQCNRAKSSLEETRAAYNIIRTWKPRQNGQYTAEARELARGLIRAGCAAGKVEYAVESCARAFGIQVERGFMSARTVGRALDEGGKYGELQLASEIMDAPGMFSISNVSRSLPPTGFVESSDGTTLRGITAESRHITLLVPSYAPGVDDSDQSTWSHRTRFMEVDFALDHTAQRQFEGTLEAANRIADVYSRSPLAVQQKRVMDKNIYWRKKIGEMKDHAADGKKGFKLSEEHKRNIVIQDLGRAALDDSDVTTGQILTTILSITEDELQAAGNISASKLQTLSTDKRAELNERALERKLGEENFDSLTPAQRCNLCSHTFGGCCCHKDLNVTEAGYKAVEKMYDKYQLQQRPVLLANKANSTTIRLGKQTADNPAVQKAIDSSSSGAIKLVQLIGALLRHKDGQRGYQDRCRFFMQEHQSELYNVDMPKTFPDVSNTRYSSNTKGAAYVICYHGLIQQLIEEIMDGKAKSGQANHVEFNILQGLKCPATMTEMAALALYGVAVSWPYMALVRGGDQENPTNLLSLTDLHRRLPIFCAHIADHPYLLLDSSAPLDVRTIDGKPFSDRFLLHAIAELRPCLPNFLLTISCMFGGAERGWIHFTPEFHIGGTFDKLTPEQRAILHIPTTNDRNEGMLGSLTTHLQYHPNSTAHSFSNQARAERNNTESFIKKCCDAAVEKYVMREVRKDGASGKCAKFRRALVSLQREKAQKALKRREDLAAKKKQTQASRLAATALEFDVIKIRAMTSAQLKDQLAVYRDVVKDEILTKTLWKNMAKVDVRRDLVLKARERELARRAKITPDGLEDPPDVMDVITVDEFGYSEGEDAEWEDIEVHQLNINYIIFVRRGPLAVTADPIIPPREFLPPCRQTRVTCPRPGFSESTTHTKLPGENSPQPPAPSPRPLYRANAYIHLMPVRCSHTATSSTQIRPLARVISPPPAPASPDKTPQWPSPFSSTTSAYSARRSSGRKERGVACAGVFGTPQRNGVVAAAGTPQRLPRPLSYTTQQPTATSVLAQAYNNPSTSTSPTHHPSSTYPTSTYPATTSTYPATAAAQHNAQQRPTLVIPSSTSSTANATNSRYNADVNGSSAPAYRAASYTSLGSAVTPSYSVTPYSGGSAAQYSSGASSGGTGSGVRWGAGSGAGSPYATPTPAVPVNGSTAQYAPGASSPTPAQYATPQYTTLGATPRTLTAKYEYQGGQAQGAGQGVVGQQVGPLLLHPRVVARVVCIHILELRHVRVVLRLGGVDFGGRGGGGGGGGIRRPRGLHGAHRRVRDATHPRRCLLCAARAHRPIAYLSSPASAASDDGRESDEGDAEMVYVAGSSKARDHRAAPQHVDHHAQHDPTSSDSSDTHAWAAEQARRMRRLRIVPADPRPAARANNDAVDARMRGDLRGLRLNHLPHPQTPPDSTAPSPQSAAASAASTVRARPPRTRGAGRKASRRPSARTRSLNLPLAQAPMPRRAVFANAGPPGVSGYAYAY